MPSEPYMPDMPEFQLRCELELIRVMTRALIDGQEHEVTLHEARARIMYDHIPFDGLREHSVIHSWLWV